MIKKILSKYGDVLCIALLAVVFVVLYCSGIYNIPFQVNTDEITIMIVMKKLIADGSSFFGLSYYFGFPSFIFIALGHLATMLGGIDLYHVRLVHSLFGVAIILLGYVFFRLSFTKFQSLLLALLLGFNHSLLAISRMAMRDNTGLFFELLALVPLLIGFQKKSTGWVFAGGLLCGLTFYTYFPSRITIIVWCGFLVSYLLLHFSKELLAQTLKLLGASLLGFFIVATPILLATGHDTSLALTYSRQQFLFLPEGKLLQQQWVPGASVKEAIHKNIINGLTTFNNHVHDYGYIYPNYGHGFVDPATGVLLWIGFVAIVVRLMRRKDTPSDILALVGFLSVYISFALLITKAPNYTRLLIVLPFVLYLAGTGLFTIGQILQWALGKLKLQASLFFVQISLATVLIIAAINMYIFNDFVAAGFLHGNDVGSTGRFVEGQKKIPMHSWILAADKSNMYYSWGETWQWQDWLGFFAGPTQITIVIPPQNLLVSHFATNTTLFMNSSVWTSYQYGLRAQYPNLQVVNITPEGRLLAIELR